MKPQEVTDEMLMAYVDGELDAQTGASVAAAIAADPALTERADLFRSSAEAARSAFADILTAPPPPELVQAARKEARSASILSFPSRTWVRAAMPLAACLLLAVGLGGGYLLGRSGAPVDPYASLATAIAIAPAGTATALDSGELMVLGSYPIEDGLCRSFALTGESALNGVACDRGAGYAVEMTVAGPAQSGFAAASDRVSANIDAYLDSVDAGAPLGPDEEAERFGRP